jgi:purine-binding chemotaxis protein CheW
VDIEGSGFRAGQYLTFRVDRQDCAMETRSVRGILPWSELAARENADGAESGDFVAGFASLRGQIFPVIDLGRKLGFARASRGRTPCIIVVETTGSHGPTMAGFVADVVSEVVDVGPRDFRRGKIQTHGRPRRVIDAAAVLSPEATPAPASAPE